MSDTASTLGFPEAARRLGVKLRVLRRAIRTGSIPAPAGLTATSSLPADWLASTKATIEANPKALSHAVQQKVRPFARYKGTSAWRKYSARVREYAHFRAHAG